MVLAMAKDEEVVELLFFFRHRHRHPRLTFTVSTLLLLLLLLMCWAVGPARSDFASDQAQCGDALVGLASCLTYVEGSAKAPTPDCCTGLKQVLGKSPKCLCVLIKDRNDPNLGFKIDTNRAFTLPRICNAPANTSHCPDLLNLPPGSKEAEIFKQFGNTSSQQGPSGTGSSSSGGGGSAGGSKAKDSSGGARNYYLGSGWRRWRWWALEEVAVLSLFIMGG